MSLRRTPRFVLPGLFCRSSFHSIPTSGSAIVARTSTNARMLFPSHPSFPSPSSVYQGIGVAISRPNVIVVVTPALPRLPDPQPEDRIHLASSPHKHHTAPVRVPIIEYLVFDEPAPARGTSCLVFATLYCDTLSRSRPRAQERYTATWRSDGDVWIVLPLRGICLASCGLMEDTDTPIIKQHTIRLMNLLSGCQAFTFNLLLLLQVPIVKPILAELLS